MPKASTRPIVSLLSDFGNNDHYVGVMKAVIAGICPEVRMIDISHQVEPFRIAQGAYLLAQAWKWFPSGTVHLAVVDPGVGGARRAIAAAAHGHFFVLPDNGLLSLSGVELPEARQIRNAALMLEPVSQTFHGRDIFAPASAMLASGFAFDQVGPLVEDLVQLRFPSASVLHIDRFGNVVTGLRAKECEGVTLRIGNKRVTRFARSYSSAPIGELFLIEGSGGYLEVSEREASAQSRIGCRVGDPATLEPAEES